MRGDIPALPLYALLAWRGETLLTLITTVQAFSVFSVHSSSIEALVIKILVKECNLWDPVFRQARQFSPVHVFIIYFLRSFLILLLYLRLRLSNGLLIYPIKAFIKFPHACYMPRLYRPLFNRESTNYETPCCVVFSSTLLLCVQWFGTPSSFFLFGTTAQLGLRPPCCEVSRSHSIRHTPTR